MSNCVNVEVCFEVEDESLLTSLERENTFEKMVGMMTVMKVMMGAPRQQLWTAGRVAEHGEEYIEEGCAQEVGTAESSPSNKTVNAMSFVAVTR
jgi:hypothetical protein